MATGDPMCPHCGRYIFGVEPCACQKSGATVDASATTYQESPDYKALARRLSDALLKVRPLGGSELFIRVGNEFFADPDVCGAEIEQLRDKLNQARRTSFRARRATSD